MITRNSIPSLGVTIYACELVPVPDVSKRTIERSAIDALVRFAFGLDAVYDHDEFGAPFIPSVPSCHISVSHCTDRALLAVSHAGLVGVDIEAPRQQLVRIAHKFLTPREQALYPSDGSTLLHLWTAKEAVFKAAGIPSLTVSQISVDLCKLTAVIPTGQVFTLTFLSDSPRLIALARPQK